MKAFPPLIVPILVAREAFVTAHFWLRLCNEETAASFTQPRLLLSFQGLPGLPGGSPQCAPLEQRSTLVVSSVFPMMSSIYTVLPTLCALQTPTPVLQISPILCQETHVVLPPGSLLIHLLIALSQGSSAVLLFIVGIPHVTHHFPPCFLVVFSRFSSPF